MEIITNSFTETQEEGHKLAKNLKPGDVVCLYGDLGSGKTTFAQGLARGLGIKRNIISPTFVIVRQYEISDKQKGIRNFYHIDLYRIENEKDVQGLGLQEILNEKEAIVTIEWADKIKDLLPEKRTEVYFEYVSHKERRIIIK